MEFNADRVRELKEAYDKAVADGSETFMFDGDELVVTYAKYLIEFLIGEIDGK